MLVTVVVSALGSGHVTRQLGLMQELLRLNDTLRIRLLCTPQQLARFKDELVSLKRVEVKFLPEVPLFHVSDTDAVDIGKTKSSFEHVLDLSGDRAYRDHWQRLLKGSDVVINDIESVHNPIVNSMGIPIVNISNFTWSDLLEGLGLLDLAGNVAELESMGDLNLRLPFTTGCRSFGRFLDIGLLCREIDFDVNLPFIRKPFITVLGGNIKRELNLESICSELNAEGFSCLVLGRDVENAICFPQGLSGVQNIIGQSEAVIGKVGFSTVAEIYCAGVPFIHFTRQGFLEDKVLSEAIVRDGRGVHVDFEMDGLQIADHVLRFTGKKFTRLRNEAHTIAKLIFEEI